MKYSEGDDEAGGNEDGDDNDHGDGHQVVAGAWLRLLPHLRRLVSRTVDLVCEEQYIIEDQVYLEVRIEAGILMFTWIRVVRGGGAVWLSVAPKLCPDTPSEEIKGLVDVSAIPGILSNSNQTDRADRDYFQ